MTAEGDVRILVVEDERNLADLYATWLDDSYSARVAYSGEEALDCLDESIDVVFLDRRMPGLSGDDVLETIRERGYHCRVAMVTAVEPNFDIVEMGFDDYLVKPVTREDLDETVERLTARSAYNEKVNQYATLLSKKTALESEKTEAELNENEEFQELTERIDEIESEVDPMVEGFGEDDIVAVLRDIPVSSET